MFILLGGGVGYLSSQFATPIYEADAKLYIQADQGMIDQSLVEQYSEIIESRTLTSEVLNKLNAYNINEKQLMSMVKIDMRKDSNVFMIKAESPDPYLAANVANVVSQVFVKYINQIVGKDALVILDKALVPKNPLSNHQTVKILLGIFLGLIVSVGTLYLLAYFDLSVLSAKDIEEELDLRIIGLIPEHDIR